MEKQKLYTLALLLIIFSFGLFLRHIDMQGGNLVFDYDQIEDQFYTLTIARDLNPSIIGRAVYGDPKLHHGVFYYYYNLIPFFISGGDIFTSAYWNGLFNAFTGIVIFIIAKLLFKKNLPGYIAAFIIAISPEFIKFSNWLTIDTIAILLIPLFYLGLWGFYKGRFWSFLLLPISLGLSIQSDLSLLYLIPAGIIFGVIFKPKLPNIKTLLLSFGLFILSVSTLIITEIKLHFSGVRFLLNFSENFQTASKFSYQERFVLFYEDFFKIFSNNLYPTELDLKIFPAILIIFFLFYYLYSKKTAADEKKAILFVLFYLFSPAVTLILGYHDTPWFLIGLPGAIALATGYVLSKFNLVLTMTLLFLIASSNLSFIYERPSKAYQLFDSYYDSSSYLAFQLETIDYTYNQAENQPFAINSVTYPLYYNSLWEYLYNWYGKGKYGYVPTWAGGDQLYPYNLLPKSNGQEKLFFMLISQTQRIPKWEKDNGKIWALKYGNLVKEKINPGFVIQKYEKRIE